MANTEPLTALAVIDGHIGANEMAAIEKAQVVPTNWEMERSYVKQIALRNPMVGSAIVSSPNSLIVALKDLAAMGLTLSPTLGLAYLIPDRPTRDSAYEVRCQPSYKGLEAAVLRSGHVKALTTDLVYEGDDFAYTVDENGPHIMFKRSFKDRGALVCGFTVARLENGEKHVEIMEAAEIDACQEAALNRANGKMPPSWRGPFANEMRKKCVVRRAVKHFRLDAAMEPLLRAVDREVGVTIEGEAVAAETLSDADIQRIREALPELDEQTQSVWMLRKAQALGFASIRDVAADQCDVIAADLAARYANIKAARAAKQHPTVASDSESTEVPTEAPRAEPESAATEPQPASAPEPVATPAVAHARARRRKDAYTR